MNRDITVKTMFSDNSMKGAIVFVEGLPGRITHTDKKKSHITVEFPAVWYECDASGDIIEMDAAKLAKRAVQPPDPPVPAKRAGK